MSNATSEQTVRCDNVIPDVLWVAQDRLAALLDSGGHLTGAPDLAVEVLSMGGDNERRDRETKLKLYSVPPSPRQVDPPPRHRRRGGGRAGQW